MALQLRKKASNGPSPRPSRRERENRLPLRGESNALGSSQAHGRFERCFPLTPSLSLRERENHPPRFRQSRAPRLVAARDAVFPLPEGEGQGEGEGDAANQNGRTKVAARAVARVANSRLPSSGDKNSIPPRNLGYGLRADS